MQEQKHPESSFEKAHSDEVFGSLRVPEDLVSTRLCTKKQTWVVVKIMVPFWIPIIIRHLIFRVPKKIDHNFDNHPHVDPEPQASFNSVRPVPVEEA